MYAIYLRKSRLDIEAEFRGDLETLSRHQSQLLELAKKYNFSIGKIYKEVVSGESIDARPEMQKLLEDIEKGMWEGVLVMEVERLARGDTIDQGIVARTFKQGNAKIVTPIKIFDPNNEFDEEYFEFGLFMSRREYKVITRRIQRGRIQSAKEGRYLAPVPPYGYDRIKIKGDKGYTLTPNTTEADAVRYIFSQYNSGLGATCIANALDSKGIATRTGKRWSKATIMDILKNPVYIGKIRWSYEKETKDYQTGRTHRAKNNDYIYVDGLHDAIVSDEIFETAQKTRKKNTHTGAKNDVPLQNPLSGILYCKKCGSVMTRLGANSKTKYDVLKCSNRYCDNVSAPLALIESEVLATLHKWVDELEINIKNEADIVSSTNINKTAEAKLKREIETIEKQINNTYDLLEQGVYDINVFTVRNQILSAKKAEIERKLEDMQSVLENSVSVKCICDTIIPGIKTILNSYEELTDAAEKNRILKELIQNATYLKNAANKKNKGNTINFKLEISPYPIPFT